MGALIGVAAMLSRESNGAPGASAASHLALAAVAESASMSAPVLALDAWATLAPAEQRTLSP